MQPQDAPTAISTAENVAALKHAVSIQNNRNPVRIGFRRTNVFRPMVVLAHHIGA